MRALLIALALLAPPGVHYKGTVGTGSVAWTPPGIARDTGASYPLMASGLGIPASFNISGVTVSASSSVIVVVLVGSSGNGAHVLWAPTIAWNGGTPEGASTFTLSSSRNTTYSFVNIWTATTSQSVSAAQINFTFPNAYSDTGWDSYAATVDALTGASGTGVSGNSSSPGSVTLSGVTAGSWLYAGHYSFFPGTLSDVSGTTRLIRSLNTNNDAVIGVNTDGTSGSVTVGWTASGSGPEAAALEIKK